MDSNFYIKRSGQAKHACYLEFDPNDGHVMLVVDGEEICGLTQDGTLSLYGRLSDTSLSTAVQTDDDDYITVVKYDG